MNKKSLLIIAALILMGGAAYLLLSAKSPQTVVITESPIKNHQLEKKSEIPDSEKKTTNPTPALPAEIIAPQVDKELQQELTAAMEDLPTNTVIQDLPAEETHHTPEPIIKAGKLIGSILQKAESMPERRQQTLRFCVSCAENEELVDSVRALCWNSLMTKITSWKIFVPISNAKVPQHIKSLASKLR